MKLDLDELEHEHILAISCSEFNDTYESEVIVELIRQNRVMKEAIEFYADRNNWALEEDTSNMRTQIRGEDLQEFRPNRKAEYCGGLKAREVLKDIKGRY